MDDINFVQAVTCSSLLSTTTRAPTTTLKPIGVSTFEDGGFGIWNQKTPDKPWTIGSGRDAIFGQAPLSDHTLQNVNGKYAFVAVRPTGGPIYYSTLSFQFYIVSDLCLEFWYQAFVSSTTVLNVYSQMENKPTNLTWSRPGTTVRDVWTFATIPFKPNGQLELTISGNNSIEYFLVSMHNICSYFSCRLTVKHWLCCYR